MSAFLLLACAYGLGSIPTSLWIGKGIHGVDLRLQGSANLGATNAFRVLGWKTGLLVLVVDTLKGWLPTWLFPRLDAADTPWAWVLAYGGAAILGHVFSVWARFRGGKGVATSAGVLIGLAPWAVLLAASVWAATVLLTRTVSLGSILAALALPAAVALTPHQGGAALLWFSLALAAFVVWAHRANLRRLLKGEEHRFQRGPAEAGARPSGDSHEGRERRSE